MTRRSIQWTIVAAMTIAVASLAAPRATMACSCVAQGPMVDYRGEPGTVVFTGVTESRDDRGFPVTVTRWFQGDPIAPRVWLAASSFDGNSASCGIDPLPAGIEWIFIAYRVPGASEIIVNLCAPHEPLSTPGGQAMLADAQATFGGPRTVAPTLPPSSAEEAEDAEVLRVVPAIIVTMVAGLTMILGVYLITSRRRGASIEVDELR